MIDTELTITNRMMDRNCYACKFLTGRLHSSGYVRYACSITGDFIHHFLWCSVCDSVFDFFCFNYVLIKGYIKYYAGGFCFLNYGDE